MRPVIWIADRALRERIGSGALTGGGSPGTIVKSVQGFVDAMLDPDAVGFVDQDSLATISGLDGGPMPDAVVAVCNEPLPTAVGWLLLHPWLSHVVNVPMLQHPMAIEHFINVLRTMATDSRPRLLDWLGPDVTGRRVRLTHASRRGVRLDRMADYLSHHGTSPRTVEQLRDTAEELLTNAFYNAPVAAGTVDAPIPRTQDVALPEQNACDLAYGCREDLAIVRVKDAYGSLSRRRLVEVLNRCAKPGMQVEPDESMGGAGLGLWRIFSHASFVVVSVVRHQQTEFLVGIAKRAIPGTRPFAVHLFFRSGRRRRKQDVSKVSKAS